MRFSTEIKDKNADATAMRGEVPCGDNCFKEDRKSLAAPRDPQQNLDRRGVTKVLITRLATDNHQECVHLHHLSPGLDVVLQDFMHGRFRL